MLETKKIVWHLIFLLIQILWEKLPQSNVAVSITDSSNLKEDKKGGLKIAVLNFKADAGMGTETGSERTRSTSNRIKFSVPVYFQYDKEKRKKILKDIEDQRANMRNAEMPQ